MHALRRTWHAATLAVAVLAVGAGCSSEPKVDPPKEKFKAAWLYTTSPGDGGWTYAHDQGRKAALAALSDVDLTTLESVSDKADNAEGIKTKLKELITAGNKLIFAASFGFGAPMYELSAEYPDVKFEHCAGVKPTTDNFATFFGRMYQARYLSGVLAGRMSASGKLGYVAAFANNSQVIRGLNAFTLGARKANPNATVEVRWTSTWFDVAVESAAAKELLAKGCDVLGQHQDSTATVMAAKDAGAYALGYDSDMVPYAPDTVLATPIFNWGTYYTDRVKAAQAGTWKTHKYWGDIGTGIVDLGPYGNKVPQAVKDEVAAAKKDLVDGKYDVFWGPIKKHDGTDWIAAGAKLTDAEMLSMTNFVEGVILPPP
ncbi:MAG TPA: BMP family ABC transporter substrate-binding protein [Myxococcales bacterium]|jgi:basic membrane protein A